jgi:COMPASS component SDC1
MAEPTPDAVPQVAETEPAPITNGTTATTEATDVTMANSTETPAEVRYPIL